MMRNAAVRLPRLSVRGGRSTTTASARRRAVAIALLGGALVLSGCSGAATITATTSGAAMPSVPSSPSPAAVTPAVSAPVVDEMARNKFGDAGTEEGWKFSTDLSTRYAYNPAIMAKAPDEVTAADFAGIREQMTADARKDWDRFVKQLPSRDAQGKVNGIALQGLQSDGYTINLANPVTDYVIDGSVTISNYGTMVTTQRQRAAVHMLDGKGAKVKITVSKTIKFYLKEVGGEWKIDGWNGEGTAGKPTPDV